jgi:hypothetical protein
MNPSPAEMVADRAKAREHSRNPGPVSDGSKRAEPRLGPRPGREDAKCTGPGLKRLACSKTQKESRR